MLRDMMRISLKKTRLGTVKCHVNRTEQEARGSYSFQGRSLRRGTKMRRTLLSITCISFLKNGRFQ